MIGNQMFYIMNNHEVIQPELLKKSVRDIASRGFDSILLQLRDTVYQLDDEEVINAVKVVTEESHARGLKLCLTFITTSCRPFYRSFLRKYPEAGEEHLVKSQSRVHAKRFKIEVKYPDTHDSAYLRYYKEIFNVFRRRNGKFSPINTSSFLVELHREKLDGGRGKGGTVVISGKINEPADEVIAYVSFWGGHPDYAHPKFSEYLMYLLELYKDIPLDGVAWDEPGAPVVGIREPFYKMSSCLLDRFKRQKKYNLVDKIYLLDYDGEESYKLRYDYFGLLRDVIFEAQKKFVSRAREIFGKDITSGIHHTWAGEAIDSRAGCLDYFKLSQNLTGGFTDCVLNDQAEVNHVFIMAKSLAKYGPYKKSWVNYHDPAVTEEMLSAAVALGAGLKVRWIGHAYGQGGDFGPGYPLHRTWNVIGKYVASLNQVLDFLEGAEEFPEIAVLHTWENLARINDFNLSRVHHNLMTKQISHILIKKSLSYDYLCSEQVKMAKARKGRLLVNGNCYKIIVLTWPVLIEDDVWDKVCEFGTQGGTVVFMGAPAERTISGKRIKNQFFDFVKCEPFTLTDYFEKFQESEVQPNIEHNDCFFFPLVPKGKRCFSYRGGDCFGVQGDNGIYYFSHIGMCKEVVEVIKQKVKPPLENLPEGIMSFLYRRGEERIYILVASKNYRICGKFVIEGNEISIPKSMVTGIRVVNGKIVKKVEFF